MSLHYFLFVSPQFLDCLWQLWRQNPGDFEWSDNFLESLAYSHRCGFSSAFTSDHLKQKLLRSRIATRTSLLAEMEKCRSFHLNELYIEDGGANRTLNGCDVPELAEFCVAPDPSISVQYSHVVVNSSPQSASIHTLQTIGFENESRQTVAGLVSENRRIITPKWNVHELGLWKSFYFRNFLYRREELLKHAELEERDNIAAFLASFVLIEGYCSDFSEKRIL